MGHVPQLVAAAEMRPSDVNAANVVAWLDVLAVLATELQGDIDALLGVGVEPERLVGALGYMRLVELTMLAPRPGKVELLIREGVAWRHRTNYTMAATPVTRGTAMKHVQRWAP